VLFADNTSIILTTCNVEGGTDERITLNGSQRNVSKLKTLKYVDIWTCNNFILSNLLPINWHPILTQTPTQRYLPQNAVTLHYTRILLHKYENNNIYHKMPLPCTTPVDCYTNTKKKYLPRNAINLHYTSILLQKQQHNVIYHKMPLPYITPGYCYTNTKTIISTTKCRYLALHQ